MDFDDVIDVIGSSFTFHIPDTEGYSYDIGDEERILGESDPEATKKYVDNMLHADGYRNMIPSFLILSEKFTSIQQVKRAACAVVQSCYYIDFGAHHITCDKKSMTIRYVTVGTAMFITGSITLSGAHYEKLYLEYLDFLEENK